MSLREPSLIPDSVDVDGNLSKRLGSYFDVGQNKRLKFVTLPSLDEGDTSSQQIEETSTTSSSPSSSSSASTSTSSSTSSSSSSSMSTSSSSASTSTSKLEDPRNTLNSPDEIDFSKEDFNDPAQRLDNIQSEFKDVNACFEVIKNKVEDSPAEIHFLSILQHLLCITDDIPTYYKLIEESTSQIVLHQSRIHQDFKANENPEINFEHLVERSRREGDDAKIHDETEALVQAQAKLVQIEDRLTKLEKAMRPG